MKAQEILNKIKNVVGVELSEEVSVQLEELKLENGTILVAESFEAGKAVFIKSEEDEGREMRQAKLSITPDLIGDNQPTFQDEITLTYAGASQIAQIVEITTTNYLFTLVVRF